MKRCILACSFLCCSSTGFQIPLPNGSKSRGSHHWISPVDDAYTYRPIPTMPSPLFVNLAQSQMELLAFSVKRIKAMSLYLPQENSKTGQLEFLPGILYPHSERVFIANDATSGEKPMVPRTLTRLPGFEHAASLLPGYPMVSSDNTPGIGSVEEVMCDPITKTSALSVPLFQGSQTVGVLIVWSTPEPNTVVFRGWSKLEKDQISRAAQSLSMALMMDTERKILQKQSDSLQTQLSDALHQVKNPIQALRTYGKLLQRQLADSDIHDVTVGSPQLLGLIKHLMVQSDRVVDLMLPLDDIANSGARRPLALNPYTPPQSTQLTALTTWVNDTAAVAPVDSSRIKDQTSTGNDTAINPRMDFYQFERKPSVGNNTATYGHFDFTRAEKKTRAAKAVTWNTMEFSSGATSYSNGTIDFQRRDVMVPRQSAVTGQSQMESETEPLEMGFVMDILEPILDAGKVLASERGIKFEIRAAQDLPGIWTNTKAVQEAVSNVLDNALKYVTLGQSDFPQVVVEASRHSPEPGVVLSISDNGPGISPEEVYAIFKRGYRGERTSSIGGTGIGLDISQSMLSKIGAELRLSKTSQHGSTFEIILYRRPP